MPIKKHTRQYDLVVFGATGYTGKLTCQHIVKHLPSDLKWAVAGRSDSKLQALVEECRKWNPDRIEPAIEACSLTPHDLDTLTQKAYLLITTVGPYVQYGHHAYKSCAENGTHYLDVTGEAIFTSRMIKQYSSLASSSGAMLFSQVGIESAPSDLCTWMLAKTLREQLSAQTGEVVLSAELSGRPSGGTLASALGIFENCSMKELRYVHRPFALSPVKNEYASHKMKNSWWSKLTGLREVPGLGLNTTSIANGTDGAIVGRTWGLLASLPERRNEFYGERFSWVQYMGVESRFRGMMIHLCLIVFSILLAALPPFRRLVKKFVAFQPGDGPDMEASKKNEIRYRGFAKPDSEHKGERRRAYCEARYRGSMYYFTGALVGQAALAILEDDLNLPGGAYTPACLGQGYVDRLAKVGFAIETKILE